MAERVQKIKKLMITLHFSVGKFQQLPKKHFFWFPIYIYYISNEHLPISCWNIVDGPISTSNNISALKKDPGIPSAKIPNKC